MTLKAKVYRFSALLTRGGWLEPAYVAVGRDGNITSVSGSRPAAVRDIESVEGFVIPGFVNGHSHAFQYAMAGLAEYLPAGAGMDDFWSWREAMYHLATVIEPDEMEAVATVLYSEMLRFGFTSVVEFHYLHHAAGGGQYDNPAEMGARLIAAAEKTGIRLTLVPVLYQQGGFGRPPAPGQARFVCKSLETYFRILESSVKTARSVPGAKVGFGVHSLRAVATSELTQVLAHKFDGPFHLHIAEQAREVEDCLQHLGQRPVEWLLDHVERKEGCFLVHATHMTTQEARRLAESQHTVVVCPGTEGNLGDGFFPLLEYMQAGGRFCIGSDSHIGLSPVEDLRWLDYANRLQQKRRNVICRTPGDDSATMLVDRVHAGGQAALGKPVMEYFAVGQPFDAVVIDPDHPVMTQKPKARRLGAFVYSSDPTAIKKVFTSGQVRVDNGRHVRFGEFYPPYEASMSGLLKR